MIGFDRSAFVAGPDLSGLGNQNVNRVCVQFMTKVFRSVLSKIRSLTDLLEVHQSCNQQRSEILAERLASAQGISGAVFQSGTGVPPVKSRAGCACHIQ